MAGFGHHLCSKGDPHATALLAHSLAQLGVVQVIRPRGRYVGPMPEMH